MKPAYKIMNRPHTHNRLHPAILTTMLLSLFYWSYLGLTAQTIIFHDSIGYQSIATMILDGPWTEYFRTGPNREPLYPLLISISMRVAQWLKTDYLSIQIMVQLAILSLTQFLTANILKKLRVSNGLIILFLAYLGFSPALVNSGLILFSEILTYPLILWLVLRAAKAWQDIQSPGYNKTMINALGLALAALLITFTKGIFEIIAPLLVLPYLFLLPQAAPQIRRKIGIFLVIFMIAFQLPVVIYKSLNKMYNGVYTLTDRGPTALYGNTARRMQPLDAGRLKTAIAYTAGPDFCNRLYSDACAPWGFLPSDILGSDKSSTLRQQGLTAQQINDAAIKHSVQEILKNPFQYVALTALEGLKLFFWESPQIYCVVYPDFITKIYNCDWLRYLLRFLTAAASLMALAYGIRKILRNRKLIVERSDEKTSLEFYLVWVVTTYIAFYSLFFLSPRYALSIIPLFLALTACFWQDQRNNKP